MSGRGVDEALAPVRGKTGPDLWQGLDELIDRASFRQRIAEEFPALARLGGVWKRRDILKCLGGALALAGLDGCERSPDEEALPYVEQPEGAVPGVARYYATAVELDGVAQPVIGKTFDGRPIKLEGNPDHPASLGATDAFTQAALLNLYDPSRSATPRHAGGPADWDSYDRMLEAERLRLDARHGAGFRLLTGPVGSPTLLRQIDAILARWPEAQWHVFEPLADRWREAAAATFGRPLDRRLQLEAAQVLVALDADPIGPGPLQTFHARGWGRRRQAYQRGDGSALLFAAEPTPSLTGVMATDRLIAAHDRIPVLLAALAARFGVQASAPPLTPREAAWAMATATALDRHRGSGLVLVGAHHPPELQQLALAIDARLGNLGRTQSFSEPPPSRAHPFEALIRDLRAGAVDTLFILETNPVYAAPADLDVQHAVPRARLRIHAGLHDDETARLCQWHVPTTHALEHWSDGRAADGSAVLIQPLVRPYLDVHPRHALLASISGARSSDRDEVRATWAAAWGAGASEQRWNAALLSGKIDDTAPPAVNATAGAPPSLPPPAARRGFDVIVRPDPSIWDGAFASNPWLQELPKPLTKITWGNAVLVSPALAAARGLENGQNVRVSAGGRSIVGPIWILPGQEENTILVHLGHGRTNGAAGPVADGIGFDANPLRTSAEPSRITGATLEPADGNETIATTQVHFTMAGHDFVRFVETPQTPLPRDPEHHSFYPPQPRSDPAWGMSIDLDLCIGCNACVSACVAENNIPMVGKEQVANQREMHWLRVDRYYEGPADDPKHMFQPVPCMHCEDAPCEMGCPVNATVHSPDGLNLQVYNRCIGTRTCSAYCPYKVRRFNWFDFTGDDPPELRAARNPQVTVRGRGVMEKCTYCIQRIMGARIDADKENRPIGESEVKTACQQACPTDAIVFGNVARADSAVSRRKASGRNYGLLPEAQTRPRTTYLARIERGEGRG